MTTLQVNRRLVQDLGPATIDEYYALYAACYDATSPALFAKDLLAKDWVIELREAERLAGFSTLAHFGFTYGGRRLRVVFSGDTVIDPVFWGSQALTTGFSELTGALAARYADEELWWLLISKGYRTYRYLPLFAREYYPHPTQPIPDAQAQLMHALGRYRFGDDYSPERGVVAFPQSQGQLNHTLADIRPDLLNRPEVAYFLQRNPGYRQGHELLCLTRLCPDNLRGAVARAFARGLRHGLG
ncbi:hypothetical protein [Parachitinimonas caeni]|uniref:GNAT family N-acetyltransferase n=1 Tax=Parachitinimonas caeni TaxID=3031301 RepID=A0ABT7E341_9NEIS|nr:hypothetical protein [Parachitinimonas caeni]MDK2125815.1 hypothetical protein [Parachitinimonas caeni]